MVEVDSGEGPQLFTDTSNYAKDRFFLVVFFFFVSVERLSAGSCPVENLPLNFFRTK